VSAQDDPVEIFEHKNIDDVSNVRLEIDVPSEKMPTFSKSRQRRREHLAAFGLK
jgi:hypothetical protein